jgi:hypothetical protein
VQGGTFPGDVAASLPTGSASPTFTFTAPAGSYYVRVHALSGTDRSAASNEIRLHVDVPVIPSPPAHLLSMVNGSTAALSWINTFEGGAPSALLVEVSSTGGGSIPLGLADHASFEGVPGGTYEVAVRAVNAAGSSQTSSRIRLTLPRPCSGAPLTPAALFVGRVDRMLFADWIPASAGPAPTSYVLHVTGPLAGSIPTTERALSGTVAPGSYTLRVAAVNGCGESPATPPQTVIVP